MWFLFALSASLLWGLEYAINGKILQHIHSKTLLLFQLALGFLFVLGILLFSNVQLQLVNDYKWLLKHKQYIWLLVLNVLIYLVANFCIYESIFLKNGPIAAVIETIYPFFTFLFCYLFFKENFLSIRVLIGSLLIFVGVSVLSSA